MKKIYIFALVAILGIIGLSSQVLANPAEKVNLCHQTNSANNPWIVQSVNANEVQSHLANGDFLYNGQAGINSRAAKDWCASHAIKPTPSPTIKPTPTCSPSSTPTAVPTPTVTPTSTPTTTPAPSEDVENEDNGSVSSGGTPSCQDKIPTRVAANFHVYRNGGEVIAKWLPDTNPEGNEVTIYYGHNGSGVQYSTTVANNGYALINVYDSGDYTFWAAVKNGCTEGPLTLAVVDGATANWVLFTQALK